MRHGDGKSEALVIGLPRPFSLNCTMRESSPAYAVHSSR
jgi:hypothetical protein